MKWTCEPGVKSMEGPSLLFALQFCPEKNFIHPSRTGKMCTMDYVMHVRRTVPWERATNLNDHFAGWETEIDDLDFPRNETTLPRNV